MKTENCEPAKAAPEAARKELLALLYQFNISPSSFDNLRNDSYEKHLAGRSLAELESAYLTLLKPGEASAELQKKFPRWSKGHKYSEQLPSINTLMSIKHRIVAEETANGVGHLAEYLESLCQQMGQLPGDLPAQVFNAMLAVISEELFKAKFDGKPLSENLRVVDRLLKAAVIRYRERQGDKRTAQRDRSHKIQLERLGLAKEKFAHQMESANGQEGNDADPEGEGVEEDSGFGMTESEKTEAFIERIYGKADE
jgi:hypothetical protein